MMIYDWLKLIGSISRTKDEFFLYGRYKIIIQETHLTIQDSFDDFKLLGAEHIKGFEHFLDFIFACISKTEKWN